ncbi:GNAT family N-acetyltransferase [Nocardia sp. NPDC049707]|uniref:GNAT family N-acetyltransferase n=1 Tax=Nocardia sp. NPDC049707 TaxID=3154735 RepID=UPI003447B28E
MPLIESAAAGTGATQMIQPVKLSRSNACMSILTYADMGIAQQLLARLESNARNAGYRAVILDTGSKRAAAHALYEKCGYNRTVRFSIYKDSPGTGPT